jgi:hypothetical protein
MIKNDELKALEDIVGPQWVSDDQCTKDAYSIYYNSSAMNEDGSLWAPQPAAVVLPKTTQEVSDVTKFCNKQDYKIKPFSTGWIATSAAGTTKTILLDLKRMDKIIDIDVKNQIAVIEPYVKAVSLQTELWKVGLDVHMVSAGANHSTLASTVAGWGYGFTGASMGHQARNMLGVEWVMPSGEIITLGSAGDGAGWFISDGPGPGLRGAMRGFQGTLGGLGTFTKCGVKLYKWDGPPQIEMEGPHPIYQYKDDTLPPNISCFALSFPTWQALVEAGYKLGEAGINNSDAKGSSFFLGIFTTENNMEFKKLWETGLLQSMSRYVMAVAVVGYSQEEYDWKIKAMNEIISETDGMNIPLREINIKILTSKLFKPFIPIIKALNPLKLSQKTSLIQKIMGKTPSMKKPLSSVYLSLLRNANNTLGAFRPTGMGGMFTTMGTFDTWDVGVRQSNWLAERKRKYIEKGLIIDDDGDCGIGGTYENGHMGYVEGIGSYSPAVKESVVAARELTFEGIQGCIDNAFGVPIAGFGDGMNKVIGPHCSNYHLWMEKIKDALDPNASCDSWTYSKGTVDQDDEKDMVFF